MAQVYDGEAATAGNLNGTQALIEATYTKSLSILCYVHVLNLAFS
jgi:hypothetical protein